MSAEDAGTARAGSFTRGLIFRVTAFLSLALAPIGVVGVIQTQETESKRQESAELSLLALTGEAASREYRLIERGLGAAEALGPVAHRFGSDRRGCALYLEEFVAANPNYAFAGFVLPNGAPACATAEWSADTLALLDVWIGAKDHRERIDVTPSAHEGGGSTIVISQPVYDDDAFVGHMVVSIPQISVGSKDDMPGTEGQIGLVTFNAEGVILTTERSLETAVEDLPLVSGLSDLANNTAWTFTQTDRSGDRRLFAVVPLIPDVAYAIGIWDVDLPLAQSLDSWRWAAINPILMWLASLFVAVFALDRLVLRPVRLLEQRMVRFGDTRELPSSGRSFGEPQELKSIQDQFHKMAMIVTQDEAELEDLVREKDLLIKQKSILLKEVHHRVKNNLQLISSIMNMQMRAASQPETERVLRRLQDRILGLAAIHRRLYQTEDIDMIDGAQLLRDLAGQTESMMSVPGRAQRVNVTAAPVLLVPDQAVPFSLLVSELLTNAIKHSGAPGGKPGVIDVSLEVGEGRDVRLRIGNPLSGASNADEASGLGTRLIGAFVTQLDGELEVSRDGGVYATIVRFNALETPPETPDF